MIQRARNDALIKVHCKAEARELNVLRAGRSGRDSSDRDCNKSYTELLREGGVARRCDTRRYEGCRRMQATRHLTG